MPAIDAVKSILLAAVITTIVASATCTASADDGPLPRRLDRALDCAALALVATSIAEPSSPTGKALTERSIFFRMVYGIHLVEHTKRTVTNGDLARDVNGRALLLNSMWTHDNGEVLATHRLCTNWIAGIGRKMMEIAASNPSISQADAYRQVSGVPIEEIMHRFPEKSLEAADLIITTGFENWRAAGLVTSDTVQRSLRRSSVTKP